MLCRIMQCEPSCRYVTYVLQNFPANTAVNNVGAAPESNPESNPETTAESTPAPEAPCTCSTVLYAIMTN